VHFHFFISIGADHVHKSITKGANQTGMLEMIAMTACFRPGYGLLQ